jgi:ankyrin repeat protein
MEDMEDYCFSQDAYLEEQHENDLEYLEALLEKEEGDCCHTRPLPARHMINPFKMHRNTFHQQLMSAAESGDMWRLRELFRREEAIGCYVATSRQIEMAMRRAAEHAQAEACRFLFPYRGVNEFIHKYRTNPMSLDRIGDLLKNAVRANNLVRLFDLLMVEDGEEPGCDAATYDDIESALRVAIGDGDEDRLAAFRLLCKMLTPSLKEKYAAATMIRGNSPLHVAVTDGRIDTIRVCVHEYPYKTLFNINQRDEHGCTPLDIIIAIEPFDDYKLNPEICRLLVQNRAHLQVPIGLGSRQPLEYAISEGSTEVAQVLLEYGADPNFTRDSPANEADEEFYYQHPSILSWEQNPRYTDMAIVDGAVDLLSSLIQYGGFVRNGKNDEGTSLNKLFRDSEIDRERKISTCRVLVENVNVEDNEDSIAVFLQSSLEKEIKEAGQHGGLRNYIGIWNATKQVGRCIAQFNMETKRFVDCWYNTGVSHFFHRSTMWTQFLLLRSLRTRPFFGSFWSILAMSEARLLVA